MRKLLFMFLFLVVIFSSSQVFASEQFLDYNGKYSDDFSEEYNTSMAINYNVIRQGGVIIYDYYGDSVSYGVVEDGYIKWSNTPISEVSIIRDTSYDYDDSRITLTYSFSNWWNDPFENTSTDKFIRVYVNTGDFNTSSCYYVEVEYVNNVFHVYPFYTINGHDLISTATTTLSNAVIGKFNDSFYYEFNTVENVTDYLINASDVSSSTIVTNKTVNAGYYFTNLFNNFPVNNDGSCGYVALSILLSYYDIFYNKDILYETIYNTTAITSSSVTSFNLINCNSSPGPSSVVRTMLIDCASYIGIDTTDYGLTLNELYSLVNGFMNYFSDYTYSYSFSSSIIQNESGIMSEIDSGRPVLMCLSDFAFHDEPEYETGEHVNAVHTYTNSGHVVVAYGYVVTDNGDVYYKVHTGFHQQDVANVTSVLLKPLSDDIKGISFALVNNVHNHSNSYYYNGYFCPCVLNNNYAQLDDFQSIYNYPINNSNNYMNNCITYLRKKEVEA